MAVDALRETEPLHGAAQQTRPSGNARTAHRTGERVGVGTVIAGRYQVVGLVGEGSFGSVYRADDLDVPGHTVALKLMHRSPASRQERERCLREVRLIAAVEHPSVVSFKDHGWHRERFYIVMPWYDGVTLSQRLKEQPEGLSRSEAQLLFERLAEGLAAMHAAGVRHQDIKPDNILLARFGEGQQEVPVLLDMGVGAEDEEHVPAFTPAYVAPEMARAHIELCRGRTPGPLDGKSDVYALALTLWDALAPGDRPIRKDGASPIALADRARDGGPVPVAPGLSDLRASFVRWLHVEPARRPSASQFRAELSVLTLRERRRAERMRAAARWGPAMVAVLAVSASLYGRLSVEKDRSRTKDAVLMAQAAQIDRTREALGVLEDEHVAERRAHSAARVQQRALREQLAHREEQVRALEQAALAAEEASVVGRTKLRRQLQDARSQGERLGERVAHLEEALSGHDSEQASLRSKLARSEAARRKLIQRGARLQSQGFALARQLAEREAELAELSRAAEEQLAARQALEQELRRMRDLRAAELDLDRRAGVPRDAELPASKLL